MRIAVACDGMDTSPHATRCESFMCYTVEKGIITDCRNLPNMSVTGDEVFALLRDLGFDVLITRGIDMDTATKFCELGIEVVAGAAGTAREVVEAYVSHQLLEATNLCGVSCHGDIEEDPEDEAAFEKLAKSLGF